MKFYLTLLLCCCVSYLFSQDYAYQDSISGHQTCVAYCSINDGHPGPPGQPFFQSTMGVAFDDAATFNLCISNTFASEGFFRNSLFTLNILNAVFQDNQLDVEESVGGQWQQTWMFEKGSQPTISTLLTVQQAFGNQGDATDIQTMLIVNKNVGRTGVLFFNGFVNTPVSSSASYGILAGYKLTAGETTNLFVDALYESTDLITLETALEINLPHGSVISPGLSYTRDINSKSNSFGVGLVLLYQTR